MSSFFHAAVYNPLYNALIFLIAIIPGGDVGVAIVALTFAVKLALLPLSQKTAITQMKMKELEPKLNALKEKYKDQKEELAKQTLDLYRREKVNPLGSFLILFIQLPIIFALYFIFFKGGLPNIHPEYLYSFIPHINPENINLTTLGLLDLSKRSIILALIAGVAQYFQITLSTPPVPKRGPNDSFSTEFARSMSIQSRYIFPVMIVFLGYTISAAVSLYWVASNLFDIGHRLYLKRFVFPRHTNNS